ncbi:hypothetical protein JOQ06_000404, partial [Pogonophryne albipinna]
SHYDNPQASRRPSLMQIVAFPWNEICHSVVPSSAWMCPPSPAAVSQQGLGAGVLQHTLLSSATCTRKQIAARGTRCAAAT